MQNDVREVLEGASHSIYGREPDKVHVSKWNAWRDREIRFRRFLDAEAYLDAAMMLVPEDFDWIIGHTNGGLTIHAQVGTDDPDKMEFADHPALALATAALKAKEQP